MATTHARIYLRGHGAVPARLEATRYPVAAWIVRTVSFVVCWLGGTWLTLAFTFDPFVASFPFVLGLGLVYNGVMGRYKVHAFRGSCPRCGGELRLKAGSKINLPHKLVCYACHHEPELSLAEAA